MKKQNLVGSLLAACLMASCSSGSSDEIIPSAPEKPAEKRITRSIAAIR